MIRVVMLFLVISVLAGATLGAQEVSVKKSFWSGWQYSTNGIDYDKVGVSATKLKFVMADNELAIAKLNAYSSNQMAANIFGSISGGMIGWWLGGEIANKTDNNPTLAYAGLVLMVPMIILEAAASSNLKEAVELYKDKAPAYSLNLGRLPTVNRTQKHFGLLLSYQF